MRVNGSNTERLNEAECKQKKLWRRRAPHVRKHAAAAAPIRINQFIFWCKLHFATHCRNSNLRVVIRYNVTPNTLKDWHPFPRCPSFGTSYFFILAYYFHKNWEGLRTWLLTASRITRIGKLTAKQWKADVATHHHGRPNGMTRDPVEFLTL